MDQRQFLTSVAAGGSLALSSRPLRSYDQSEHRTFATPDEAHQSPPEKIAYVIGVYAGTAVKQPNYLATAEDGMNQQANCFTTVLMSLLIVCFDLEGADRSKFSADQQLVVAAFELDVKKVESLLKDGANPNARFGIYDQQLFEDKWTLGYSPIGSDKWTALLAVADSHRAPQPEKRAENTSNGRKAAIERLNAIDPKLIAERDIRRKEIAKLLIDSNAELDRDDGYGSTALALSVYYKYESLALLLIESGAKIDTKTGVYIDGPADIRPVHRATSSPVILKAMLKRGAKVNVQSSDGDTPLHWAVRANNVECVKLLLDAGADSLAKDKEGRIARYWCRPIDRRNAEENQIANMLQAAAKSKK